MRARHLAPSKILVLTLTSLLGACHALEAPGLSDASARVASFSHNPTPQSCSACHAADEPADGHRTEVPSNLHLPPPAFEHDHDLYGERDCVSCHNQPENVGNSWSGAQFDHKTDSHEIVSSCLDCHQTQIPTEYRPEATAPSRFLHSQANTADQDCSKCHSQTEPLKWEKGKFPHLQSNGLIVGQCKDCHFYKQARGHYFGLDYTSPLFPDCASCHDDSTQAGGPGTPPEMKW